MSRSLIGGADGVVPMPTCSSQGTTPALRATPPNLGGEYHSFRMPRFLWIALIVVSTLTAQDSPYTLKVDVSMVSVDVSVFDNSGLPVSGLEKRDFAIFEDGRQQE